MLELQDFFDEDAGHDMRRVGSWEALRDVPYALNLMTTDQPRVAGAVARAGLKVTFPFVWRYMTARYRLTEEAVERSKETLTVALDRIESERRGGDYLVGESFTVADLAAALLYPMVWPPEFPYKLPDPPSWEFLDPMRDHPALTAGSRGSGTATAVALPRSSRMIQGRG